MWVIQPVQTAMLTFPVADTANSRAGFEAEAMPHLKDLYRTAMRMTGDAGRAQDAVQETYLQAWKSFNRFEAGTNCRAWLFKILFHCINHYRRKWLSIRMVRESEEILEHAPGPGPAVPEHISDQDMLAALADIPQDYRAAVLLVDVEEFSYKEVAGILNVPIGTVMSRISRGRRLLRDRLEHVARSYGIGQLSRE